MTEFENFPEIIYSFHSHRIAMRSVSLLALVSATASAETYLCPFMDTSSIPVMGSEHHVHVVDSMLRLDKNGQGCADVTPPEGMEQYLVEMKNAFMIESALALDPEVYNVRQLAPDYFLIQSPPGEAAYTLHTTLFECDFDALTQINTSKQVRQPSTRTAQTEEKLMNKNAFVDAVGASWGDFSSTLSDLTGESGSLGIRGLFCFCSHGFECCEEF
jgi:hypothetical protein